ncbi:MAG: RluA family pseudouridine synthase [Bdellovibrionales bacterium]|nr:RluA family pseudouridine synthase [Bdellovibrionales bacterium]
MHGVPPPAPRLSAPVNSPTTLRAEESEERLDSFVAARVPSLSRSRCQQLIESGQILVDGKTKRSNYRVRAGETVEIRVPPAAPVDLRGEDIPLHIYHEDDDLVVLEKPAGMVVHPSAGHGSGTLVHALLHRYGGGLATIGGEERPGIIHRIDKNTSGVMVVTRTDRAHLGLAEQFQKHSLTRRYLGLAWGNVPASGDWLDPLARDPRDRQRIAVVPGGRRARTEFRRKEELPGPASLFEAELHTGRTHQIRVHFSHHGFPLVGDAVYTAAHRSGRLKKEAGLRLIAGKSPELYRKLTALHDGGRQFLHAHVLGFVHPVTGGEMRFESPLPADLREILGLWTAIR